MAAWSIVRGHSWFVVGLLLAADVAFAQSNRPARPFRSLFGGSETTQSAMHALDFTLAGNGVLGTAIPPRTDNQELYSARAQLAYARRGERVTVEASGSGSLPYDSMFPDLPTTLTYDAVTSISYSSGPVAILTSANYAYSPYYNLWLDQASGLMPPGGSFDYQSAPSENQRVSATASLNYRLGRRTSASLAYQINETVFVAEDRSNRNQQARVAANRRLSRSLSLQGSYAYNETDATTTTSRWHDAEGGVEVTHRSARGNNSTLSITAGASVFDDGRSRTPRWNGSVRATQIFGTGWTAGAGYGRSVRQYGVMSQPASLDVVNANVTGRFGRRVNLSCAADYSSGNGMAQRDQTLSTLSGSAGVQIGLATFMAIQAGFFYRGYDFPAAYDLPAGLPQRIDTYAGSVGLQARLGSLVMIDARYLFLRDDYPAGYNLPEGMPHRLNRQRLQVSGTIQLPLLRAGRTRGARPPVTS